MGVDLKVMASSFRELRGELLPTASLRFERDTGLFALLTRGNAPDLVHPLPEGLKVGCYEDEGLIWKDRDRYGELLTFTTPSELQHLRVPENLSDWNRAVLAFLLALPDESRIILYWC